MAATARRATPAISERQWQTFIIELATRQGWRHYHTHDSRRSAPGWPDLALCRPPEFLLVELKAERGKLTTEQSLWLEALERSGVECHVWRPSDEQLVIERLHRHRAQPFDQSKETR